MFLVLRLRSIKFDPFRKRNGEEAGEDKVIALPAHGAKGDIEGEGKAAESGGTPLEQGLTQIKLTDLSFESESFVRGAKVAFDMVVDAFAKGDTKNLRPLLSNDVYEDFSGAIKTPPTTTRRSKARLSASPKPKSSRRNCTAKPPSSPSSSSRNRST